MDKSKKKNEHDWLVSKLGDILEYGKHVMDSYKTTDYGYHTALKLIVLGYITDAFFTIANAEGRKADGFDGSVYIDMFAGTGLVRIEETEYFLGGSPVCASMNQHSYDHAILVDSNKDNCDILRGRMEKIQKVQKKYTIINGDINEKVDDVIKEIQNKFDKPLVFAFVDPEGLEIKFRTLKKISDAFAHCDFLININAPGISRAIGKAKASPKTHIKSVEEFLDLDAEVILGKRFIKEQISKIYGKHIEEILGKVVGDEIKIQGEKHIEYHLLWNTRSTLNNSPYSRVFSSLKEKIDKLSSFDVKQTLEVMHKKTKSMDDF